MTGDTPYYTVDPVMDEARRQHRIQSEPADDTVRQLYTGSCTGCEWTTRGSLDGHMLQEAFDAHMTTLQEEAHRTASLSDELMDEIEDLRGCMDDGYDADDVNRTFGRLESATGLSLVCVWEYFDDAGVGGNSQFYVSLEDDGFHEVAGDLWEWLNADPDSPSTPAWPGTPDSWIGAKTESKADFEWDDGRHNCAFKDPGRRTAIGAVRQHSRMRSAFDSIADAHDREGQEDGLGQARGHLDVGAGGGQVLVGGAEDHRVKGDAEGLL